MKTHLMDHELTLPAWRFPKAVRCASPYCHRPTRCPGEFCRVCRAEQEIARAKFRRVLEARTP